MRKFTYALAFVAVFTTFLTCTPPRLIAAPLYYEEGNSGRSETQAYIIDSVEDLNALRDRVNNGTEPTGRYYKQTANITTTQWTGVIGDNDTTHLFTGHYDGGTHYIVHTGNSYAIFGHVDSVGAFAIKNLNVRGNITGWSAAIAHNLIRGLIEGCNVQGSVKYWSDNIVRGGIVGYVRKDGIVKNCRFMGSDVHAAYRDWSQPQAGGIVGYLEGGTVENCLAKVSGKILAYSGSEGGLDVAQSIAGGIVGYALNSATIKNCVFVGDVVSKQYAGGIVGYMSGGTISNCSVLNTSNITGNLEAGGIAGYLGDGATAENCIIEQTSYVEANDDTKGAAGGIVGHLNASTLKNDKAYTSLEGRARYKGKIVGMATGYPNVYTGNYYGSDIGATNDIGEVRQDEESPSQGPSNLTATEATEHAVETVTVTDPVGTEVSEPVSEEVNPDDVISDDPTPPEPEPDEIVVVSPDVESEDVSPDIKIVAQAVDYETTLTFSFGDAINTVLNILEKKSSFFKDLTSEDKDVLRLPGSIHNTTSRTVADLTDEESGDIVSAGETLVLVLPSISVDHPAVYVYKAQIPESTNLPVGAALFLHISSKPKSEVNASAYFETAADEDDTAVLIDDDGTEITALPENRYVNISGYMNSTKVYYPIITTKVAEAEKTPTSTDETPKSSDETPTSGDNGGGSGGGGGGCETGLGILGLVILTGALGFKKSGD